MSNAYDNFTFAHNGREFIAGIYVDDDVTPPWDREDCHGPVSEWRSKGEKRPGEVPLNSDRYSARFYDGAEATRIAKRDKWGIGDDERAALAAKLGREPTRGEVTAAAVRRDFEYLHGWCNDEWHYCGVAVRALNADGAPIGEEFEHARWGIESNADDYLREVARNLADQIPSRIGLLAADMAKLGKALHDAIDHDGEPVDGLRAMADDLQQMAAVINGD